jgi:hypothetical protein
MWRDSEQTCRLQILGLKEDGRESMGDDEEEVENYKLCELPMRSTAAICVPLRMTPNPEERNSENKTKGEEKFGGERSSKTKKTKHTVVDHRVWLLDDSGKGEKKRKKKREENEEEGESGATCSENNGMHEREDEELKNKKRPNLSKCWEQHNRPKRISGDFVGLDSIGFETKVVICKHRDGIGDTFSMRPLIWRYRGQELRHFREPRWK